jgi:surface carbohydrate biosynthesis protein
MPDRDLPGLVLVAAALAKAGVECFIIPHNLATKEGLYLHLDLVLLNYLRRTNEDLAREFFENGTIVTVLDQEGGVMPDVDWFQSKLPEASIRKMVRVFFAWGQHLADVVVARGLFEEKNVYVTGSLRMDYFLEPYRTAALDGSVRVDALPRPMVMINTRFSLVNPEYGTRETEKLAIMRLSGRDQDEVERWQDIQQKALEEMVDLANSLASQYPHITFVFRPHPFENLNTYKTLLKNLPNLHLIREGSIHGWIMRASAIIHRCSSTAIEAGIAGVPALSPRWIAMPQEIESAESVSVGCKDFQELGRKVEEAAHGGFSLPPPINKALSETLEKWFYRVDGKSHQRIAERILTELKHSQIRKTRKISSRYYDYHRLPDAHTRIESLLRRFIRLLNLPVTTLSRTMVSDNSGRPQSWKESKKAFSAARVQELLDRLSPDDPISASQARGHGVACVMPLNSIRISAKTS